MLSCESDFEETEWETNVESRDEMIDYLTSNILPGKEKAQIIDLLGEPNTFYFKEENALVYNIGMEDGLISIDSKWLLIYLDENSTFKSYKIQTD